MELVLIAICSWFNLFKSSS